MDSAILGKARKRAASLQIDVTDYFRILLRNAQLLPSRLLPPLPPQKSKFARVKMTLALPPRERSAIVLRLAKDDTFSSHLERLVLDDVANPGDGLLILARDK